MGAFVSALQKEIMHAPGFIHEDKNIDSIYIGGGTPSLLEHGMLENIFTSLRQRFPYLSPHAEITLEANPDDVSLQNLLAWKKTGINRLSLGIQSFDEKELQWMNRAHHASQALESLQLIKSAGFENYSVDLIYGSPLLNDEQLCSNIKIMTDQEVPHISCYALTVEPKTALHTLIKTHPEMEVDGDKQARQFDLVRSSLEKHGYRHYEISNFSKPGMESRHNSSYWQGKPYYGFGPAAHSYNGNNIRRWNVANNAVYIKSIQENIPCFEEEILTTAQVVNEHIMTQLRTAEGVSLNHISVKFGEEWKEKILANAAISIKGGHLRLSNHFLTLTNSGKFLADGISVSLFV